MPDRMRALFLVLVLLLATVPAKAQEGRDLAAEVLGGAEVQAHLIYEGSATGTRSGSSDPYALSEARRVSVRWDGPLTLWKSGGKLQGSIIGEWTASASRDWVWDYQTESSSLHEETHCAASGYRGPLGLQVEATPEDDGLRVVVKGYVVPTMSVEGACQWSRVETTVDGTTSDSGARALEANVVLVHGLETTDHDVDVSFLVPYDGRASKTFSYSEAIPHGSDLPANQYCGMSGEGFPWASGTCSATGRLEMRTFVDPCPYIRRVYPEHHAALAGVQAPTGADEAGVRAWSAQNAQKVRVVLGDQRAWQLAGCAGDLQPDPWDAIGRVLTMQRDALLQLMRDGKLSREGISELLGAERAMQLMGVSDSSSATLGEIAAASPATASGKLEVSVHSPVSLHVWSEDGGHVGWDPATNASKSTIPGASYTGAPGGAQSIVLPAGFYKVVVDELAPGEFVLEAATNGTGADTVAMSMSRSVAGRATTTHFAVTEGWDGPRLDLFPVRRGPSTDAPSFIDEGRPSVSGVSSGRGGDEGTGTKPGGNGASGLPWVAALAALALAGGLRRRAS